MGNTQTNRPSQSLEDYRPACSPPLSPGSPLTYTPQTQMEPIRAESTNQAQQDYPGAGAWPVQPKLVPVVIIWGHGGTHVEVEGSFDNWTTRQALQRSGKDFTIIKLLPPGVYQYKFIVDGEWKYDPNQPAMFDDMRNVNNVMEVHEYVPENLEGVSGFDPPPSPPSSYTCALPAPEDYAKEPPAMPPQLEYTLLNLSPPPDSLAGLPRPQHVVLNHMYCRRDPNVQAIVIGATTRYKAKYVTTVMYKPKSRARRPSLLDPNAPMRTDT